MEKLEMLLFFTIAIACQEKLVENAEWLASKELPGLLNYFGIFPGIYLSKNIVTS